MKQTKFFKHALLGLFLSAVPMVNAQTIITDDLSWTSPTGAWTSTGTIDACGETVNVTLTTTGLQHRLNTGGSGAYFPDDPDDAGNVTITLTFSPAVENLSLLINDFDEHAPGGVDDGTPSEFGSGFSPAFNSITPIVGSPVFVATGGNTGVDPNGAENTQGRVGWTGTTSSVTFTYERPDAGAGAGGWGLIIDEIRFECEEKGCDCSKENKFLGIGKVLANGTTSANIQLNSGGVAVSQLNVSIPYWNSLIDHSCLDCDAKRLLAAGNITNLPIIAGVAPTFVGGTGSAAEIVYNFPVPTVVNQNIVLNMQFPPVLPLACCTNRVDYCVKVQMITEKCEVCETLLCLGLNQEKEATRTPAGETTNVSQNVDSQDFVESNEITITPNPVNDFVNIGLPGTEGMLYVYSFDGQLIQEMQVNGNNIRVNTSGIEAGSYILKYSNNGVEQTAKFVKK